MLDLEHSQAKNGLIAGPCFKKSGRHADFPACVNAQPTERLYEESASKWNIKLHLAHVVVSEISTDLEG